MEKLGEEILFDILLRLPILSLIQYKCINKKWLSLISDRQFVKAKLKTSLHKQYPSSCYRLLLSSNPINSVNYEALAEDTNGNEEVVVATAAITELDYPVKVDVPAEKATSISFVGSCDGLVCLLLEENDVIRSFMLWNPTTRQSRVLAKPRNIDVSSNGEFFYGFGYDSLLDDYKLLVGQWDGAASVIAEIFSLNSNCWKSCNVHCPGKVTEKGIYCHGSLHWLSNNNPEERKIISFDMREERFRYETIPLPCDVDPERLGVSMELDCLFVHRGESSLQFEAWIMKEYGIGSSWSKEFSFSTESLPTNKYWTRLITFTRDKKMVFDLCGWEVCVYDPERRTYRCFEVRNDEEYFESYITYVETLVSPYANGLR